MLNTSTLSSKEVVLPTNINMIDAGLDKKKRKRKGKCQLSQMSATEFLINLMASETLRNVLQNKWFKKLHWSTSKGKKKHSKKGFGFRKVALSFPIKILSPLYVPIMRWWSGGHLKQAHRGWTKDASIIRSTYEFIDAPIIVIAIVIPITVEAVMANSYLWLDYCLTQYDSVLPVDI